MYQPLTLQQYQLAQKSGFTPQQIISNEKIRQQEQNQSNTSLPTQNAGSKALVGTTDFLGITKAGQGTATAIRNVTGANKATGEQEAQGLQDFTKLVGSLPVGSPERKAAFAKYQNIYKGSIPTQGEIDPGANLSNKEVAGSFGNVATNIVGAGIGGGEGETALARLGNTGLKNTALGVAGGVAQGMNDNKSVGDIAKQGLTSGLVSGVIGLGAQGLSEFGKVLTSQKVGEGMVNKSLGVSKKIIEAGKSPAKEIVAQGQINSKRGFLNAAEKTIQESGSNIHTALQSHTDLHDTAPLLEEIKNNLQTVYKDALSPAEVQGIVDNLPVSGMRNNSAMSLDRINALRSTIDNKYLGNNKWMMNALATQPERVTALKTAANTLRIYVQTQAPETVSEFSNMSKALTAKRVLDSELAKPHILTNLIEMAASGGAGLVSGGFSAKGLLTALGSFGVAKGLTSTPAVTVAAAGLRKAGQIGASPITKAVGSLARVGTQRLIQKAQSPKQSK